jgi:hypothetical protein
MSISIKSVAFGFGLAAIMAFGAQAQTASTPTVPGPSIANLPPEGPRPSSLGNIPAPQQHQQITQTGNYLGPDPGKGWYPRTEAQTQPVQPSPQYVGPRPN